MLNPLTPEPAHYAIYDIILFNILRDLDPQEHVFESQLKLRKEILRMSYPISRYEDSLLFYLTGKPHPHWIDTYSIKIDCYKNGKVAVSHKNEIAKTYSIDFSKRVFIAFPYKQYDSLKVYSGVENGVELYTEINPKIIEKRNVTEVGFSEETLDILKETLVNNNYLINSNESLVSIKYNFEKKININELEYFGFFVKFNSRVRSMRCFIKGDKGEVIDRYYLKPVKGLRTFVSLHKSGFYHPDNFVESTFITEMEYRFYKDDEELNIEISKMKLFDNQMMFNNFLMDNSGKFQMLEIATEGNVY